MSCLGFLPISLILLTAGTFCISYIIAVVRGDVTAFFPYISDTGAEIPESCIFGLFLNTASFLSFMTVYVRYRTVQSLVTGEEDRWVRRMNKISLSMGCVSSFGCALVANFQEGTVVEPVHIVGAFFTFVGGMFYCFLQTSLSYHMHPDYNGLYICRVRLAFSLFCLVSLIITIAAGSVAVLQWNATDLSHKSKFHWRPDQPGYTAHVISTFGEWVTAVTFLAFFFTFVREFHKFDVEIRTSPLVRHLDDPLEGIQNEHTPLLL